MCIRDQTQVTMFGTADISSWVFWDKVSHLTRLTNINSPELRGGSAPLRLGVAKFSFLHIDGDPTSDSHACPHLHYNLPMVSSLTVQAHLSCELQLPRSHCFLCIYTWVSQWVSFTFGIELNIPVLQDWSLRHTLGPVSLTFFSDFFVYLSSICPSEKPSWSIFRMSRIWWSAIVCQVHIEQLPPSP